MSWTEDDWKQANRAGVRLGFVAGCMGVGWIWLHNVYLSEAIGDFPSICIALVSGMVIGAIASKLMLSRLSEQSRRMRELTREQVLKGCWASVVGIAGGFIVWLTLGDHWLNMLSLCVVYVMIAPSIFRIQREFRQMRLAAKQAPEVASV